MIPDWITVDDQAGRIRIIQRIRTSVAMVCVRLTYRGKTMKTDVWLHRTDPDNVYSDEEITAHGPITIMGEPMTFVRSKRLTGICAKCKHEGY